MIISHEHKFIFAKPQKVAGSTIEVFLSNYLNPKTDIWAGWSTVDSENKIFNDTNYKGYNNSNRRYVAHHQLQRVLNSKLQNYYKITIERNPWDKYVSYHDHMNVIGRKTRTPKQFFTANYKTYCSGTTSFSKKQILVDKFFRFEHLKKDIQHFVENYLHQPFDNEKWKSASQRQGSRIHTTKEFYDLYPQVKEDVRQASDWLYIKILGYEWEWE